MTCCHCDSMYFHLGFWVWHNIFVFILSFVSPHYLLFFNVSVCCDIHILFSFSVLDPVCGLSFCTPSSTWISFRCAHWPVLEDLIIWWCWTQGNTRHVHASQSQLEMVLPHKPNGKLGSRSMKLSWECSITWWDFLVSFKFEKLYYSFIGAFFNFEAL